jgi:hypothetical protein
VRGTRSLRSNTLVHGVLLDTRDETLGLVTGRLPKRDGEIALDALTAERMSWEGSGRGMFAASKPALTGRAEHLERAAPEVPERASESDAERINAAIGVRPGDTVTSFRLLGPRKTFEVVGVTSPPPLGGRPQAWVSLDDLWEVSGKTNDAP